MPCRGATPRDYRVLPKKIFLVRHAESEVRRRCCAVCQLQAHVNMYAIIFYILLYSIRIILTQKAMRRAMWTTLRTRSRRTRRCR